LDKCTPLVEFGDDDIFELKDDGRIHHTPGSPPPRSLRVRPGTSSRIA
jgi:hypothetical protein